MRRPESAITKVVFDSSAYLALVRAEPGWHKVAEALPFVTMCTVNAAEVFSKFSEWKLPREEVTRHQALMEKWLVPFDMDLARRTGDMRAATKPQGLSLGDRACLALAQRMAVRVLTTDHQWADVKVGVTIEVVR